jgi:flagellar hook-length control protein FliK
MNDVVSLQINSPPATAAVMTGTGTASTTDQTAATETVTFDSVLAEVQQEQDLNTATDDMLAQAALAASQVFTQNLMSVAPVEIETPDMDVSEEEAVRAIVSNISGNEANAVQLVSGADQITTAASDAAIQNQQGQAVTGTVEFDTAAIEAQAASGSEAAALPITVIYDGVVLGTTNSPIVIDPETKTLVGANMVTDEAVIAEANSTGKVANSEVNSPTTDQAQVDSSADEVTADAAELASLAKANLETLLVKAANLASDSDDDTLLTQTISDMTEAVGATLSQASTTAKKAAESSASGETEKQTSNSELKSDAKAVSNTTKAQADTLAQAVVTESAKTVSTGTHATDPVGATRTQEAEWVNQVVGNVQTMSKNGQTTMRLQLYPEDLGRIDLRLTSSSDGIQVTINADQVATGRLIETKLDTLRQTLTDAGLQVLNLSVGQSSVQDQSNQTSQWQQSTSFTHPTRYGSGTIIEDESLLNESVQLNLISSSLDYRV